MKVGIDASSIIQEKTGIGSFAALLVEAMMRRGQDMEFFLYRPVGSKDLNTPGRIFWELAQLPKRSKADDVDILYSPGFSPPPFGNFKRIVTVHDLIGMIYPSNVGLFSRYYWSSWLPSNLKKAQRLIASSESTRRDIEKFLRIPASMVEVVPLAVKASFRKLENINFIQGVIDKYNIKTPYFISVSSMEPRKNHLALFRGYEKLRKLGLDLSLVIVGKPAGAEEALTQFIRNKHLEDRIGIIGYVPEEDLAALYNGAIGFTMTSLYEGFGLPALEAMSCGLTGVVSNNSSLPEVVGETALKVDPADADETAEAMKRLLVDESYREQMAAAAHRRSKEFSIDKTADRMLAIFRQEYEK